MKHIISIGINKTDGLTQLGAAVSGAKDFVKWGKSQGYATTLLIDDKKSISQSEIFNEINKIISAKNCETLIVFFSGHGILKSPSQEVWLLSNAKNNPNESINLTGSIDNARTSGIPYVVFISDACRVLPNELQFTGNGSVIFPISDDTNEDCAIDVLYAARPGNPALEQNSKSNSQKFGLFTQTIVEVLNGNYPELIKAKKTGDRLDNYYDLKNLKTNPDYKNSLNDVWQIDIINSEQLIKTIVAQKARKISIALNQNPEIRIQYQNPKPYLSKFDDQLAKKLLLSKKSQVPDESSTADEFVVKGVQEHFENHQASFDASANNFKSAIKKFDTIPNNLKVTELTSNLVKNSQKILNAKGRGSFETETGFTIIGTKIKDLIVSGHRDIFQENQQINIRIHPDPGMHSGLVVLNNGTSIPVAILEGYIGTLVFANNQLLTINYTPSQYSQRFQFFQQNEKNIDFMRAFVASAANEGFDYSNSFKNDFDKYGNMDFSNAGSYLRQENSIDPSLGLYACYAYRQEGKTKDIQSIYDYMKIDSAKIIFDISMLARKIKDEQNKLAPFCPMIALGWAYSQQFEEYVHPSIIEAATHLVPGLWTTFDKKGTAIIQELINQKLIS